MPSPYNLEVEYNSGECRVRAERLFCTMSSGTVGALDAVKFTGLYPKGSLLFVEGEEPRGIFILCSGRAKLTTSSTEGKTLIVKIAEPGEVLGASATILNKPYEVSAETIEPSQLNFIKREDFMKFLGSNVEACMHTAQQLSEKYHSAQREIRSLGLSQTTSEKLARLLLDWSEKKFPEFASALRVTLVPGTMGAKPNAGPPFRCCARWRFFRGSRTGLGLSRVLAQWTFLQKCCASAA